MIGFDLGCEFGSDGRLTYESYKTWILNIINEDKEKIESMKKTLFEKMVILKGDMYVITDLKRYEHREANISIVDAYIDSVALAKKINLLQERLAKNKDEYEYLVTDKGKHDYENREGRYNEFVNL